MRDEIHSDSVRRRQLRLSCLRAAGVLSAGAAVCLILPEQAFAFESVKFAIREICGHIQGNLGGLLMTTAGVGALVAAAFGNLRATQSMVVAGVGAITVSGLLSLYFQNAANECKGEGNEPRTARVIQGLEIDDGAGRAPAQRQGLDPAAVNTALNRDVDFSGAATVAAAGDEEETSAFDADFSEGADEF